MDDPILRYVAQPTVDRIGKDPSTLASRMAQGFVVTAVALAMLRAWTQGPSVYLWQTLHIIGAAMLYNLMLFASKNGAIVNTGAAGIATMAMRMMLVVCFILDAAATIKIATHIADYAPQALLRTVLQGTENMIGAASLYLSACDKPPPRRRTAKLVLSGA